MALLTHGDSLDKVPDGFKAVAHSGNIVAAIGNEKLKIFGVQFHPEVDLTPKGKDMFQNFLKDIVGCSGTYTIKSREAECIDFIQSTVGDNKVLVIFYIT